MILQQSPPGDALGGTILLAFIALLYFLPWVVAARRQHHQVNSIFMLNFLLGWTVLGWIMALVWSVSHVPRDA